MKSPIIDNAVKDKPTPMAKKIPVDGRPEEKSDVAEFRRTLVEGVILWPRRFGVPQGNLAQAFKVASFAYTRLSRDPLNPHVTLDPARGMPSVSDLEEGPHDDETFRITYRVHWQEPQGWGGDFADHPHATRNYIVARVVAAWPANGATGPGTKSIRPAGEVPYTRGPGPTKGPTFSVVHDAG
jgi:hypothetical protein